MVSFVTCEPKEVALNAGPLQACATPDERHPKHPDPQVQQIQTRCCLNLFGRKGDEGFEAEIECPREKMLFVKKWREMKVIDEREESKKR
ncbi:hypothetical protein VNO80_02871 [Phaseolus coccineus]|uniref:Uncharacterized protein n=1 Tax=Phaseolus coccineus TaxID=3886 RepID=A0AAN9NQP6_PHACN